jgi:hypothetical protein
MGVDHKNKRERWRQAMSDYEAKTNEELNQFAVERLNPTVGGYDASDWPDYLHSLDACFRDYVPVIDALEILNFEMERMLDGRYRFLVGCFVVSDNNPARAFTIAFLMATEGG